MDFRSVVSVLFVFIAPLCATAQSAGPPSHYQKVDRLRLLFAKLQLDLPLELSKPDLPPEIAFTLLENFATREHQWAMQTPQVPREAWTPLDHGSYPGGWERAIRSTSIKTEVIQQPKTVQIYDPISATTIAQRNPDSLLWKVSATADYSQVIPASGDVQTQAAALTAAGIDLSSKQDNDAFCTPYLNTPVSFHQCVLRTGGKYMSGRLLSGLKGTFSWVQNPHVFSNAVVPAEDTLENQVFSGEADFDPSKVILTGSDWLTAYQSASAYGAWAEESFVEYVAQRCGKDPHDRTALVTNDCVQAIAGPHGWSALAAALIPTVTFVEKTNFDFTATNGVIVANPYPSKRLADLTFTVDLTRVIPSAKARQDALTMLATAAVAPVKTPNLPSDAKKAALDALVHSWASQPEDLDRDDVLYDKLRAALNAVLTSQ